MRLNILSFISFFVVETCTFRCYYDLNFDTFLPINIFYFDQSIMNSFIIKLKLLYSFTKLISNKDCLSN